jgi:hypothetical protein
VPAALIEVKAEHKLAPKAKLYPALKKSNCQL